MLKFQKYSKNDDGNVAVMFGLTLSMVLLLTGVAVDFTNVTRLQSQLQSQVDAAVLAAATIDVRNTDSKGSQGESEDDREKRIRTEAAYGVLEINGYDLAGEQPVMTLSDDSVTVSANVVYKPFFGGLIGKEKMNLSAVSESGLGEIPVVDIVLVLDNTESMSVDGKMDALKAGATKLVEAIEDGDTGTKIGLVPFARYVRVDKKLKNASWLAVPAEYDHSRKYKKTETTGQTCVKEPYVSTVDGVKKDTTTTKCTGGTTKVVDAVKNYKARWDGCLGTREYPHSEKDETYSVKIPGLLNVQPRGKHSGNPNLDKYTWCPRQITELTDKYKTIKDEINGMWTTDSTYMPAGLIWGQRVLSPGEPFDNSPEKGEAAASQYMVLMTDGHNTTEIMTDTSADYNLDAPPYIGSVNSDETATEANKVTERMCNSIKAEGIKIFTIAFKVTDANTKSMLRKCASQDSMAMTADDNAALVKQFEGLAKSLKEEVRLMR